MVENNREASRKRIAFNIPSYLNSFPILKQINLTPTEQKLYLQLSLEFQIILDNAPSFQMGAYKWSQLLPERLKLYGITNGEWERISSIGDENDEIQEQLNQLIEKLERKKIEVDQDILNQGGELTKA